MVSEKICVMEEKIVIITGAASGIGKGIARKFLGENWRAVCFDISKKSLEKTAYDFNEDGFKNFEIFEGDCGTLASWQNLKQILGGCSEKIGAVINNAGIGINKPVQDLSLEEWNRVMATNVASVFLSAKVFGDILKKNGAPMVNIASTRALMSEANTEAYSASKGAIVSLTHALAMSLAPARVNCISPGWIDNGSNSPLTQEDHLQHPAGRAGVPSDIAELAFFLADNSKSGFITGQNFYCDGGMTKKMIYV